MKSVCVCVNRAYAYLYVVVVDNVLVYVTSFTFLCLVPYDVGSNMEGEQSMLHDVGSDFINI